MKLQKFTQNKITIGYNGTSVPEGKLLNMKKDHEERIELVTGSDSSIHKQLNLEYEN